MTTSEAVPNLQSWVDVQHPSTIRESTPVTGMQTSQDPLSQFQTESNKGSPSMEHQEQQGQGKDAQIGVGELDNEEDTYHSSSTTNSYRDEWFRLFERDDYLQVVKQEGKKGRLRSSRFRSICWKIYLDCLPEDRTAWLQSVRENRKKYDGFREQHIHSTKEGLRDRAMDPTLNNPLSQMEESPWNRFFQDKDCRTEIKQDVVRCFPEIAFFKSEKIRDMMIDILFCFAKENSHVLYKQGMHELLAPLMFVIHCDQQAFLHAKEMESQLEIVSELMNPDYLEHDSYTLFCHLMETAEPWFHHGQDFPAQSGFVQSEPFSKPEECNPSSPLVKKLNRIREFILKKHDFELYTHLNQLDIQPQIYGIRWLRLLFGREFTFQDLIVLWDAIFADSPMLDLVDYIFVAMLIKIRELLLTAEYANCLMLLMRYPTVDDIHYLVNKALHLRDPKNNPRQANYQFQIYSQMKSGNVISTTRGHVTVPKKPVPVVKKTTSAVSQGFNSLRRIGKGANAQKDKGSKSKTMEDLPHPLAHSTSDLVTDIQTRDLKVLSKSSIAGMETLSSSTEGLSKMEKTGKQAPPSLQPNIFAKPRSAGKKHDPETEMQLAVSQSRFNELQNMCRYCASKMEAHILQMQDGLLQLNLQTDDELFVSLAGLKQLKDIMNGKLRFTQGLIDPDEISINDNHYSHGEGAEQQSIPQENQSDDTIHTTNNNSNANAPITSIQSSSEVEPDDTLRESPVSGSTEQPITASLGTEGEEPHDTAAVIGERNARVNPFNTNGVKDKELVSGGLDEEDQENGNAKCNSHPLFDS
ncbi:TBC1 domain family member 5 isoform X2 [Strongylocentrotus purpuratus]|uniref:Rab-GAP TBC domain-containing protein n=1 Tax=Strongylocentrotus purpuratus TaxID=7668 RepID=A0A7M7RHX7_STRPU|nr:TBC1 domain family member 5 isoform X2 [Strongylocentrotus purpuratus]|eukprot:XP_799336.2 PREDICTED: TBC1 domain family member 5 isoform X2 [Strongylocentrotus purpuratus]